jgi:hypothetical protein
MTGRINKINKFLKRCWLEGVLLICLLSAFLIPAFSVEINLCAAGIILYKMFVSVINNKKLEDR